MKKKKAYRLDSILESLVANRYLSKAQIDNRVGEKVIYRDLLTIRGYQHNNDDLVSTKLDGNKRLYKLTPTGVAFIEDVGFISQYKKESKEKSDRILMLVLNGVTVAVALSALMLSIWQMKSQNSQACDIEKRIESLERNVKIETQE